MDFLEHAFHIAEESPGEPGCQDDLKKPPPPQIKLPQIPPQGGKSAIMGNLPIRRGLFFDIVFQFNLQAN
jgi:hypothetical protein